MPFKTARRFFQGRPRPSLRRGGSGMSLSRVSHCASVRSRVLVRGIESLQINRCKRVLCWLLRFNSSSAFGRNSHAAQVTVTRPEETIGRQHQNEHVLATSIVIVPKVSWCCAGLSCPRGRCGRITTIRAEARVLPKQATKEQLSKCIARIVPNDYCSRLEGRNQE